MPVYSYSDETISRMLQRSKRTTFWMRVVAAVCLSAYLILAIVLPLWFGINPGLSEHWWVFFLVVPVIMLFQSRKVARNASKGLAEYMRAFSVDVSPYSVRVQSSLRPQRQFLREEILRIEEPSWGGGLYSGRRIAIVGWRFLATSMVIARSEKT